MSSSGYEPREPPRPRAKRMRPRHACNLCRARKVRCDPGDNSCSNCELAGVECVTTDPKSGASRILDRRRRESAGVQRPVGSLVASSPMSPASSGSPSDLGNHVRDAGSGESNLARRLAQMEQRLLMLDQARDHEQSSLLRQRNHVKPHSSSQPSPLSPQRSSFHHIDPQGSVQPSQSAQSYGMMPQSVVLDPLSFPTSPGFEAHRVNNDLYRTRTRTRSARYL